MKKIVIALLAIGVTLPAFAFGDSEANSQAAAGAAAQAGAAAGASANSSNLNAQGQQQGQGQGQLQGQSTDVSTTIGPQTATATGGAATGGAGGNAQNGAAAASNQQNIIFNSPDHVKYEGGYKVKSVPNAIAPHIYPSANCHGSSSVGIAVMGFGASGGSTWVDRDCQMREYARMFHTFGQADSAVALMCAQESLSEFRAGLPACNPKPPVPAPQVVIKEVEKLVTKEVIKEVPVVVTVHDAKPGE